MDPFNAIDLIVVGTLGATLVLRLVSGSGEEGEHAEIRVEEIPLAFAAIAICLRMLNFLQYTRSLGPLVGVIIDMLQLMVVFLVVISVVFLGFAIGLHGLLGKYLAAYETVGSSAAALLAASLGDYSADFDEEGAGVPQTVHVAASALMFLFMITNVLLLFNLLIAFLTDAWTQVSEDKEKAFAWARASAVLEIGDHVRTSQLPPPLNLLQLPLKSDYKGLLTRLVFTLTFAPMAIAFHVALLLVSSPVLVFLTFEWGKRGFFKAEKGRIEPDLPRAIQEAGRFLLRHAMLLPINLVNEIRLICMQNSPRHNLEPGEWVVVLDSKKHVTLHAQVVSVDPNDQIYSVYARVSSDLELGARWCSTAFSDDPYDDSNSEALSEKAVWMMVLGRVNTVDPTPWISWSLGRRPASPSSKRKSFEVAKPLWIASLELTNRSLEACGVIGAIKRARAPKSAKVTAARFSKGDTLYCFREALIQCEDQVLGETDNSYSAIFFPSVRVERSVFVEGDGFKYVVSYYSADDAEQVELPDVREDHLFRAEDLMMSNQTPLGALLDIALDEEGFARAADTEKLGLNQKMKLTRVLREVTILRREQEALKTTFLESLSRQEQPPLQQPQLQQSQLQLTEILAAVRALASERNINVDPTAMASGHHGWLYKRGVLNPAMRRRFFILSDGVLSWYRYPPGTAGGGEKQRGQLAIAGATVASCNSVSPDRFAMQVTEGVGTPDPELAQP